MKRISVFSAGIVLLALTAGSALAQQQQLTAKIPFEFHIGKNVYPAGDYKISPKAGTPWLTVSGGEQTSSNVAVMSRLAANAFLRDATLVFDREGNTRTLSEVWIPGDDGYLVHVTPKNHAHEVVIAATVGLNGNLSGKEVFERTCARCHGADGKGSEAANKFFNTQVPRLDSDYVQKKSDEELKEVISQGRRNMDPVRVGQSTVQHLLPSDSIDAVVQYVRTLKGS